MMIQTALARNEVPPHIRAQAELELRRRYAPARASLKGFTQTTMPSILWGYFQERLCRELDQFFLDVIAGLNPRLMIIGPPRHGKTEIASRRFPAYVFGKRPISHIIASAYAAPLAQRNNRDVQRVMDDPLYRRIFPDTRLHSSNIATLSGQPLRNAHIFEIVRHLGSYRGAGVGEGITGMGFDIGVIDDPVKDAQQAGSEVERNGIGEWYETTFYSRASPLSGILLIMTRWHEDDLAGRLLYKAQFEGGEQWRVVRLPAIAEEDEFDEITGELVRKEGEALHPERYPLARLEQIRTVVGSYAFAALYQGRPVPKGGGIIKKEDFKFYRRAELGENPVFDLVALSTDAAFKDTKNSSYVVTQAWGRRGNRHYLLAQSRKRLTFSGTVKDIRAIRQRFPNTNAILIEDKANGPAIIETLGKELPGVIAIEPQGSKTARAEAVVPLFEAGNVLLPHPDEEPWVESFMHEWLSVPNGAYWDMVDAADMYLCRYGRVLPVNMSTAMVADSTMAAESESGSPWSM